MPNYRVIAELPDGNGVIIEPLCELCCEANPAITCPICNRTFCVELCFGVHFNARDSKDAPDKIDAFLRTQQAHNLLDAMIEDKKVDWRHALTCDNCKPMLHEAAMRLLVDGAYLAIAEACEEEASCG
jgi:hypothetical protein